jgi:hypothetical protein
MLMQLSVVHARRSPHLQDAAHAFAFAIGCCLQEAIVAVNDFPELGGPVGRAHGSAGLAADEPGHACGAHLGTSPSVVLRVAVAIDRSERDPRLAPQPQVSTIPSPD